MKLLQKKQQIPNRRANPSTKEVRASYEDLNTRYAFRRNRTLTGSLSSDVSSVNEQRSELQSSRVQAHHLRRHRRRLFLVLSGVLVVAIGLSWLVYQSIAGVHVVVQAPLPPSDTKMYEAKIQDYLNGHPFERNRHTIDTAKLSAYLQDNGFPEVLSASVAMSPSGLGTSTMSLTMRQPVVSWTAGSSTLYVDSTGAAFARNYFSEPNVEVIDQTGIQTVGNQVLASKRFLSFLGRIIGRLNTYELTATKIILPENTTHQIVVATQEVPYSIKFSVDRPAGEQAEDAAKAITYLSSKGFTPAYIDVRVGGRAYYK